MLRFSARSFFSSNSGARRFPLVWWTYIAALPPYMQNSGHLRYAAFFWVHGASIQLCSSDSHRRTGHHADKSVKTDASLDDIVSGDRNSSVADGILFYTMQVIPELTRVLRMYGPRPVFLLSLTEN
jgi:hypothetical protein